MRGIYVDSLNGLYHSQNDTISEECFGTWMVPIIDNIAQTITKTIEDPSSLQVDEAKNTSYGMIDLVYKNIDVCQIEKVFNDIRFWCLSDLDACVGPDNKMTQRLWDNAKKMFSDLWDMISILSTDEDDSTYESMVGI
jgi:hypothetical protein